MRRIRVNLSADFCDRGGWGRHARGFASGLVNYVQLAACQSNEDRRSDHEPDGDVGVNWPSDPLSDAVGIALGPAGWLPQAIGSPHIVFTPWETSKVPEPYLARLASADKIWVPTEWGRKIFARAGLEKQKLQVVPEGVDADLFRPDPGSQPAHSSVFRFLSVGKWERRKGSAALVAAFAREFKDYEPVELVMHCHDIYRPDSDHTRAIATVLAATTKGPVPRVISSDHKPLPELIQLMQGSDAFVLPTRGEGWGLPILEAMACGLPCIVTGSGGHRAFANESNSYLISVTGQSTVLDPASFDPQHDWGDWTEPDMEHLQYLMRHVFENREEAAERGRAARRDAAERWSWDNAGRIAWEHLLEI